MQGVAAILGQYGRVIVGGLFAIAAIIFLLKPHAPRGDRNVSVGGNAYGAITTGDVYNATPASKGPDWAAVVSAIFAVAAFVVALLAWLLPQQP